MACITFLFSLGLCAWTLAAADGQSPAKAENIRWVSVDFKTVLKWTYKEWDHLPEGFTVLFSRDGGDWTQSAECNQIFDSECDMTDDLEPLSSTYSADILTEHNDDLPEFVHTVSREFNPYRESEISAVDFSVQPAGNGSVMVVISDPLTSIHRKGKQQTIRNILKHDLKYKIRYYKSQSTGKRDVISDSSTAKIYGLDEGDSYCFMVAAYIPSRPANAQEGAWGMQQCTPQENIRLALSIGVVLGILCFLLVLVVVIVVVIVLCCVCRKKQRQRPQQQIVLTSTVV